MSRRAEPEGERAAEKPSGQRHEGRRTGEDGENAGADQEQAGEEDGVHVGQHGLPGEHG